jgi:hypothetical protein
MSKVAIGAARKIILAGREQDIRGYLIANYR